MVTITQLRKQIATQKAKEKKLIEKEELGLEKIRLQKELKVLNRSPTQKRNIRLLKRTAKGFKGLAQKARDFTVKQAERIRKQQLRDESSLRKSVKKGKKKRQISLKQLRKIVNKPQKKKRKKAKLNRDIFLDI